MRVIKYFCDSCGKETKRNYVSDRFEFKVGKNTFAIIIATHDTWNSGELCLECLSKAINTELKRQERLGGKDE